MITNVVISLSYTFDNCLENLSRGLDFLRSQTHKTERERRRIMEMINTIQHDNKYQSSLSRICLTFKDRELLPVLHSLWSFA